MNKNQTKCKKFMLSKYKVKVPAHDSIISTYVHMGHATPSSFAAKYRATRYLLLLMSNMGIVKDLEISDSFYYTYIIYTVNKTHET